MVMGGNTSTPGATLARLARVLDHAVGRDITLAQYRSLGMIASGSERASKLADALRVGRPAITVMVDGLVERGWVERVDVVGDRRVSQIRLTPGGEEALHRAEAAINHVVDEIIGRCDDPELVRDALSQLAGALRPSAKEPQL
jgi:DNA-binding MarR family transcriptional regulator